MEAYCVKCRAKKEMKDAKAITMKNGKPTTQGICPECSYATDLRWVLKNHLLNVHQYQKIDAIATAVDAEYWANPRYTRVRDMFRGSE